MSTNCKVLKDCARYNEMVSVMTKVKAYLLSDNHHLTDLELTADMESLKDIMKDINLEILTDYVTHKVTTPVEALQNPVYMRYKVNFTDDGKASTDGVKCFLSLSLVLDLIPAIADKLSAETKIQALFEKTESLVNGHVESNTSIISALNAILKTMGSEAQAMASHARDFKAQFMGYSKLATGYNGTSAKRFSDILVKTLSIIQQGRTLSILTKEQQKEEKAILYAFTLVPDEKAIALKAQADKEKADMEAKEAMNTQAVKEARETAELIEKTMQIVKAEVLKSQTEDGNKKAEKAHERTVKARQYNDKKRKSEQQKAQQEKKALTA